MQILLLMLKTIPVAIVILQSPIAILVKIQPIVKITIFFN